MAPGPGNKGKASLSRIKKSGAVLTGLFALYAAVGFWVVPPLLKPRLEKELSSQIGRTVTIEKIELNPLTLCATATNLSVFEKDGRPFAGLGELFINAQLSSIVKWAATIKEIRLQRPFGVVRLFPGNQLNIDDILATISRPGLSPDQREELPPAIISKLLVKDARFTVEDASGTEPIHETFFPVAFRIENLSTLKERQGTYRFTCAGSSGGQYQLDGKLSVNPFRVQGSCFVTGIDLVQLWKHLADRVSFQITGGTARASGNYALGVDDGTFYARLQNGEFAFTGFQLTEKGRDKTLISLPSFLVQGIRADMRPRQIAAERVKTAGARIESWLAPDGTFALQRLLLPDLQRLTNLEKPNAAEAGTNDHRPWQVAINKVEVTDWGLSFEDRTLPEPARFTFDAIQVAIDNLDNQKDARADVDIAMRINREGTVKLNGSAGISPLAADVRVAFDKIALQSFQPYVDAAVNARIASGVAGLEGRMSYQEKKNRPRIRCQGEFRMDGLEVKDRIRTEDFIHLAQFKTSGIVLELLPNRLHAAEVVIDKPHVRVSIDQNGTVNVVQAFTPVGKKGAQKKKNLLQRLVSFLILQFKGPMPMDVDRVRLNSFSGDFVDESVSPAYTTRMEVSRGTVTGLSSDPSARAVFKVEGNIAPSATIVSTGRMNPMNALQYTQVDFSLKDFGLEPVSPYSGKYIGYRIDKGKLGLKLKYRVEDDRVYGDNTIMIDQLILGERVDSPEALNLPVALGVALLKDDKGRITLQVPVNGNVKDPKFDFGQVIVSALTGTIDDVGSEPFSAITEIDGFTGEDLRFIEFEFGLSALNSQQTRKLDILARFLNERAALTLGVEGTADRQMDRAGISEGQSTKEVAGDGQTDEKTRQEDPTGAPVVDDTVLRQLARTRAGQVKTYLTGQGGIAENRVRIHPVRIGSSPGKDHVRVELFLSAP